MRLSPDVIAEAYRLACLDELRAPKAGNVHDFSDGHGMTVGDFEISADVTKDWIARAGAKVGERVRGAIAATRKAVDANTNLGIVLMSAPIACAAERDGMEDLQRSVGRVLDTLDVEDADAVFQAIVLAAPAGLGEAAENDVRAPASVTLRLVWISAAARRAASAAAAPCSRKICVSGKADIIAKCTAAVAHDQSFH